MSPWMALAFAALVRELPAASRTVLPQEAYEGPAVGPGPGRFWLRTWSDGAGLAFEVFQMRALTSLGEVADEGWVAATLMGETLAPGGGVAREYETAEGRRVRLAHADPLRQGIDPATGDGTLRGWSFVVVMHRAWER